MGAGDCAAAKGYDAATCVKSAGRCAALPPWPAVLMIHTALIKSTAALPRVQVPEHWVGLASTSTLTSLRGQHLPPVHQAVDVASGV